MFRVWINYHGQIFGYDKLYILDGDSSDENLQELQSFESVGVHTFHRKTTDPAKMASKLGGQKAFTYKRKHMTNLIRSFILPRAHASSDSSSSIIIPLDTDEYVVAVHYNEQGRTIFSMNKTEILQHFEQLPQNLNPYAGLKFKFNIFNAMDCSRDIFQQTTKQKKVDMRLEWDYHTQATTYFEADFHKFCFAKTFFPSRGFSWTDKGNHHGEVYNETCRENCSKCYHNFMRSGLGLLHFSTDMMSYAEMKHKMLNHFHASVQFKDVKQYSDCAKFKLSTHYCQFKTKYDVKGDQYMFRDFLQKRRKMCHKVARAPLSLSFSSPSPSQFFTQALGKQKGPRAWGSVG